MPHYFIEPGTRDGESVTVSGPLHRHLAGSLRLRVGETVRLVDGDRLLEVRVEVADRHQLVARVIGDTLLPQEAVDVTLAMGVPKGKKLDEVVRHATELGACRIVPVYTRRSVPAVKERTARDERLAAIALEAAQQSGRSRVPTVDAPVSLEAFILHSIRETTHGVVLWEREAGVPLADALPGPGVAITLFVGPEGGLAEEEVNQLTDAGFVRAHLGPFTLRAETAALAAVALTVQRYDTRPAHGN
ncbi:MAG: 16S rRNA (uracil(1498)-N(3))-methyltransferase [Nitrospirota bacterium]|nr:16S rRNA (uracil(1498)-N(3))-methyltransferase [Nitrospirota bacterium]